jgi:hypothetical protein
MWRKRLSEKPEGIYAQVACADGEVVGDLGWRPIPVRIVGKGVPPSGSGPDPLGLVSSR